MYILHHTISKRFTVTRAIRLLSIHKCKAMSLFPVYIHQTYPALSNLRVKVWTTAELACTSRVWLGQQRQTIPCSTGDQGKVTVPRSECAALMSLNGGCSSWINRDGHLFTWSSFNFNSFFQSEPSVHHTCLSHTSQENHGRNWIPKAEGTKHTPPCFNATTTNNASFKNHQGEC